MPTSLLYIVHFSHRSTDKVQNDPIYRTSVVCFVHAQEESNNRSPEKLEKDETS